MPDNLTVRITVETLKGDECLDTDIITITATSGVLADVLPFEKFLHQFVQESVRRVKVKKAYEKIKGDMGLGEE